MSKPSRVIVLAEDRRHQNFALGVLKEAGYSLHDIYRCPLPAGHGAGEQYVRKQLPAQVLALRQRAARAATALVVLVDADVNPTTEIRRRLSDELQARRIEPLDATERAAVLVPRRNIETWVVVLGGGTANETTDYRGQVDDRELQPAGKTFVSHLKATPSSPRHWLPSMTESAAEVKKVLPG